MVTPFFLCLFPWDESPAFPAVCWLPTVKAVGAVAVFVGFFCAMQTTKQQNNQTTRQ